MKKIGAKQLLETASRIVRSSEANADADHPRSSGEWHHSYRATVASLIDGCTGNEWEEYARRKLTESEAAAVHAIIRIAERCAAGGIA